MGNRGSLIVVVCGCVRATFCQRVPAHFAYFAWFAAMIGVAICSMAAAGVSGSTPSCVHSRFYLAR